MITPHAAPHMYILTNHAQLDTFVVDGQLDRPVDSYRQFLLDGIGTPTMYGYNSFCFPWNETHF